MYGHVCLVPAIAHVVVRTTAPNSTCPVVSFALIFDPNSPLGRGLLTGHIKNRQDLEEGNFRNSFDRFQDDVRAFSCSC